MSTSYADALELALEALRRGEDLETAVARWPEHAAALRDDLRLRASLQRLGAALPPASGAAQDAASARLMAGLQAGRTARIAARQRAPWYGRFGLPRLLAATAVVVLALVAIGFFSLSGSGGTAEAATLEGVVLDNADGSLTIQTLGNLEQVTVPAGTPVSSLDGAPLALDGISVGQVVAVNGLRKHGTVQAARIQRLAEDVASWCNDDSARCQTLADRLARAQKQCADHPAACRAQLQSVTALRERVAALAALSDLKTRCRNRDAQACQAIVTFCQQHVEICAGQQLPPNQNGPDSSPMDTLKSLQEACSRRDTNACRRVQQLCQSYPALCSDATPAPGGASPNSRPATPQGSTGPRPSTSSNATPLRQ